MNAGTLETSDRLQRLLAALERAGDRGLTGAEIWDQTRLLNPGTMASELNCNFKRLGDNRRVRCRFQRISESGSRIYRYRLVLENHESPEIALTSRVSDSPEWVSEITKTTTERAQHPLKPSEAGRITAKGGGDDLSAPEQLSLI